MISPCDRSQVHELEEKRSTAERVGEEWVCRRVNRPGKCVLVKQHWSPLVTQQHSLSFSSHVQCQVWRWESGGWQWRREWSSLENRVLPLGSLSLQPDMLSVGISLEMGAVGSRSQASGTSLWKPIWIQFLTQSLTTLHPGVCVLTSLSLQPLPSGFAHAIPSSQRLPLLFSSQGNGPGLLLEDTHFKYANNWHLFNHSFKEH